MSKESKLEMKLYRKMQNGFKKRMIKSAKNFRPFDWSYMLQMIELMLDNFETYYREGNNVVQADEGGSEILLQIQEVHSLINALFDDDFDSNATKFRNKHCKITINNHIASSVWDSQENADKWILLMQKADIMRKDAWILAFQKLGEYMPYWWD